jgi:hypothetical protein
MRHVPFSIVICLLVAGCVPTAAHSPSGSTSPQRGAAATPAETEVVHDFEHLTLEQARALHGKRGLYAIVNAAPVNIVNLGWSGEPHIMCRSADDTYRSLFPLGEWCDDKRLTVEATLRVVFHDNTNVRGVTGWWEYRLEGAIAR